MCTNMKLHQAELPSEIILGECWARDGLQNEVKVIPTDHKVEMITRLVDAGVPILEALQIVKNAVGNEVISAAIETVHGSIREGESIADPLGQSGVFDDIVINMIDVGEETGELDKMLLKIADNYDAEVDASVGNLMSILEPVLIVGLGLTVGFIVVALFLPLISLLQGIGNN